MTWASIFPTLMICRVSSDVSGSGETEGECRESEPFPFAVFEPEERFLFFAAHDLPAIAIQQS